MAIREMACRSIAEECTTKEDIVVKMYEYIDKYSTITEPNGFYIHAQVCQEILNNI